MFMSKKLGANVYAQMGLETGVVDANPSRLVVMLYDGALLACRNAVAHIQNQDVEQKGLMISKAILIIDNGLRASLDQQSGGEIAQSLDGLYIYMIKQLTAANIANKPEQLQEVIALLTDLKTAWESLDAPKTAAAKTAEPALAAQYQLSA